MGRTSGKNLQLRPGRGATWAVGLALLINACMCFTAIAGPHHSLDADSTAVPSLRGVAGDFYYVLKAPLGMSAAEGAAALVLTCATAGLIAAWDNDIDGEIQRYSGGFPYSAVRKLAELGHWYGQRDSHVPVFFAGLSGVMLAGGIARGDKKLITTTALMTESLAFTMLATGTVKLTVSRDRPYVGNGPRAWEYLQFSRHRAKRSMPSGHASSMFAVMTVVAKQYPSWWVRFPAYTLAVGAGLNRIDTRQHWASDVLVGAALGYFVSSAVLRRHSGKHRSLGLAPAPGGAAVVFRF